MRRNSPPIFDERRLRRQITAIERLTQQVRAYRAIEGYMAAQKAMGLARLMASVSSIDDMCGDLADRLSTGLRNLENEAGTTLGIVQNVEGAAQALADVNARFSNEGLTSPLQKRLVASAPAQAPTPTPSPAPLQAIPPAPQLVVEPLVPRRDAQNNVIVEGDHHA